MYSCILCKSSKKDDIQYGDFLQNNSFGVHTFCLYLSSNLSQNGGDDEGFLGFLEADIKKEVTRISLLKCFYCNKKYANIGCCEKKCRRSFHFICGLEHNTQNLFCHDFRSYCHKHVRKVQGRPSSNETCLICYESLCVAGKKFNSVNVILTPCCRNGWFHKLCLQRFAKTAGYFFKCPLCNDTETFREKLPATGIFIPNQDAAWELEPNAFAELLERPNECCAQRCNNKNGRKASCENNPFLVCITCGSTAIHKQCLSTDVKQFYCADCSVAFEEGDSGRESLNSHVNCGDNEDEYIDVCHVSDKEDLGVITKLIETNNKISAKKRDSGSHTDKSDEELPRTTSSYNKIRRVAESSDENTINSECEDAIRPVALNHKRRISSDSSGSELMQRSKTRCRKISITESSEDNLENEVIKPRCRATRRRFSTDSENSKANDEALKPRCKVKSRRLLSDSQNNEANDEVLKPRCKVIRRISSDSQNSQASDELIKPRCKVKLRRLSSDWENGKTNECKDFKHGNAKSPDISDYADSDYAEMDDLTGFIVLSDSENEQMPGKEKGLNCKNCNNDSKNVSISTIESDEDNDPLENFAEFVEKKNNRSSITLRPKRSNHLNKPQYITAMANEKNKARNAAIQEEKCTQKRRTKRSKFVKLKPPQKSTTKEDNLDISCIAKRTRRKTIASSCSNMRNERKEQVNTLNVSCIAFRTRRKTICGQTDHSKELLYEMSQVFEKHHNSNEDLESLTDDDDSEQMDDGYKEKDSKFQISCIANRTRQRKSLRAASKNLPRIDEVVEYNSRSNSHSNRDICSYSAQKLKKDSLASPILSPGFSNIKNKIVSSSLLLDKFPQHYSAFLRPSYSTKSSCSNSIRICHPANYHYHHNHY